MSWEISRACDADRERYYDHVDYLWHAGFVTTEDELHDLRDRVVKSRTLAELDHIMAGMPLPRAQRQPRDYGIPANFVPPCAAGAVLGFLLATIPSAIMAGQHGMTYNVVTSLTLILGSVLCGLSVIIAIIAAAVWEDSEQNKMERRARDRRR